MRTFSILFTLAFLSPSVLTITVYTALLGANPTSYLAADGQYTGLPAFDPLTLQPPPPPAPPIATAVPITLSGVSNGVVNISAPKPPDFLGFSIEMSVASTILGRNGTFINPVFLNYIQTIKARSGSVRIRVGGNSQDESSITYDYWPGGPAVNKTVGPVLVTGVTPQTILTYDPDLLYAMSNISSLINVSWLLGLPFLNDTGMPAIVQAADEILGPNLLGFLLGNEPDEYGPHGLRPLTYNISDYITEFGQEIQLALAGRTNIVAPSVCCSWNIADLAEYGYLTDYDSNLEFVSVQKYFENACTSNLDLPTPQGVFPAFLNHTAATNYTSHFYTSLNATNLAGKELIMTEMNSASCGGFQGVSDSFGAALWILDTAFYMAYSGFAGSFVHSGGSGQYYNAFTPPPGNMSSYLEWTTGSAYYAILAASEAFSSPTNSTQIVELPISDENIYTPAYAFYEGGQLSKVALFNFITDPSGANDYTATLSIGGTTTPSTVTVKYLIANSTAEQYNITWAGQTMGPAFGSDGVLKGTLSAVTVTCSTTGCPIPVYAPSVALVFFETEQAIATQTFATSVLTRIHGLINVPPEVLATSNGRGGSQEAFKVGSTSPETDTSAGRRRVELASLSILLLSGLVVGGGWFLFR